MAGRLGSHADAIADPRAVEAAVLVGEDRTESGEDAESFLLGEICRDGNGTYVLINGISASPAGAVGLFVAYESGGLAPSLDDERRFLEGFPDGILMVADVYAQKIAFYKRSEDGIAPASVLMRERAQTQIAWRPRMSSSVMPPRSIISHTKHSKNRCAESSKADPRGMVPLDESVLITIVTSEDFDNSLLGWDVRETTVEPMRRAIFAVCTTEDVFPVLDSRMTRSLLAMMGVVISPTKWTSKPS